MEISNYFVPVMLLLPLVALAGIGAVTYATYTILRRRRRGRAERDDPASRPAAEAGRS